MLDILALIVFFLVLFSLIFTRLFQVFGDRALAFFSLFLRELRRLRYPFRPAPPVGICSETCAKKKIKGVPRFSVAWLDGAFRPEPF